MNSDLLPTNPNNSLLPASFNSVNANGRHAFVMGSLPAPLREFLLAPNARVHQLRLQSKKLTDTTIMHQSFSSNDGKTPMDFSTNSGFASAFGAGILCSLLGRMS